MIGENQVDLYQKVVRRISKLAQYERYEGAFAFGSFATGDLHPESDLDIAIVVADEHFCNSVSHPLINNIRVDGKYHRTLSSRH